MFTARPKFTANNSAMKVKCLFFAGARDAVGVNSDTIELDEGTTTVGFTKVLLRKFPSIEKVLQTSLLAVNQEYVEDPVLLKEGDEVAVIPPISGG